MASSARLIERSVAIQRQAEEEGRELTPEERAEAKGLLDQAADQQEIEDRIAELNRGGSVRNAEGSSEGGPGDQFVKSAGYKSILAKGLGSGNWSTGQVELETKTVLTSTPGTAVVQSGYESGIASILSEPPTVADLFPNRPAPGNPVKFVAESTATNAAAATAEAAAKPESALVFSETTEPVRKVATILPISDEMLEDAPQIAAYLNERLSLFVRTTEEAQILLGSGTAPNLQGIVATGRSIGTYARGTVDDNALAIFKAANGTRGSSFLNPDVVVINPSNWQAIRTAKDSQGQYYGGGPFYGPYGGPQGPAGSNRFEVNESLWGMKVIVTSSITVGTALVGAFSQGGAVWRKGGVTVEATNSHSTYFASDITTLRAESRFALGLFRPSAFVAVTGLS